MRQKAFQYTRQAAPAFAGDIFRQRRIPAANFVRQLLIIADGEPVLAAVASACFQFPMKLLDKPLTERAIRLIDDHVDAAEVVRGFNDIIYIDSLIGDADGIGFKNEAHLIVGQKAPLDVIGL